MKLIGMLDSPFVRRVAVSFEILDIPFEHKSLSVFSNFEEFSQINPSVKAPTLVCDDGTVLMDSNLILQYAEKTLRPGQSLFHDDTILPFRIVSLALAACEKTVQTIYEKNLRPEEKYHTPWLNRVNQQLHASLEKLNSIYSERDNESSQRLTQDNISTAIMWGFIHVIMPGKIERSEYPSLEALSQYFESLEVFKKYPPNGPGVVINDQ